MTWWERVKAAAGSVNRCLLVVAVVLGAIDLAIYVAQAASEPDRPPPPVEAPLP